MMLKTSLLLMSFLGLAFGAASTQKTTRPPAKKSPASPARAATAKSRTTPSKAYVTKRYTPAVRKKKPVYNPWDTPTYADSTIGDSVDGEDLTVRRAAVDALGNYNGSVVVADPTTGRILSIVNQKLALTGAFTPCSTIKLVSGLAGLSEKAINESSYLWVQRRVSMNLTTALAVSNNAFFQKIGNKIGFDKLKQYAHQFGLGEKAGLEIEGESAGSFPSEPVRGIPTSLMCSHGVAIGMTPLQLTALVSAIANGGTLYYLQYPRSPEEAESFQPKVKRQIEAIEYLPALRPGMQGSAEWGSGRFAAYDATEPVFGKTGTCSDGRTHLGWFGSYNEVNGRKLVVTVLLTGGRPINGPVASGIAGQVYKNLSAQQYFARTPTTETITPAAENQ